MADQQRDVRSLNLAMEHVINDAEHFLEDLKGQKHLKRLVKNDVRHLNEHLRKLMERVAYLETEHAEQSTGSSDGKRMGEDVRTSRTAR